MAHEEIIIEGCRRIVVHYGAEEKEILDVSDYLKEALTTYRAQVLEDERDKIWTQVHQMIAELPKLETKEHPTN
jgi:hypothetical protein